MIEDDQKQLAHAFAWQIRRGTSIFQALPKFGALPYTISEDGEIKQFSGINVLILLQSMQVAGSKDPRFFIADQIEKRNWAIKSPESKPVELMFYKRSDDSGVVMDYPEKKSFHLLNGSNIQGLPGVVNSPAITSQQIEKTYEFVGDESAVGKMLLDKCARNEYSNDEVRLLHEGMSKCLLNIETKIHFKSDWDIEDISRLSDYIEANPTVLYQVAKQVTKDVATTLEPVKTYVLQNNVNYRKQAEPMYRNLAREKQIEAMFEKCAGVIAVPYEERKQASQLGAIWFKKRNVWFIPEGMDVGEFKRWNPTNWALSVESAHDEITKSFKDEMAKCGLDTKDELLMDGNWHYVSALTKKFSKDKKNKSGSYVFSMHGSREGGPIGTIINRDSGVQVTWTYKGPLMTSEQLARYQAEARMQQEQAEKQKFEGQDRAAVHAKEIMELSGPAVNFPYAVNKQMAAQDLRQISGSILKKYPEFISATGASIIRSNENYLLIPMYNLSGDLRAVQAINHDGSVKSFMRGGQKSGTYFLIGASSLAELKKSETPYLCYAEGIATGDSFWQISKEPVMVCFDAGNVEKMVIETEKALSDKTVRVIAVDNDQYFVEKALGVLSEKLGLVANPSQGELVSVYAGIDKVRKIKLGDVVASEEWLKTDNGSYKCELKKDKHNVVVGIGIDMVIGKNKPHHLEFGNRGLIAGINSAEHLKKSDLKVVLAVPEFDDLGKRPTDWNDLLKREGMQIALAQVKGIQGLDTPKIEKQLKKELVLQKNFLRTFKVQSLALER